MADRGFGRGRMKLHTYPTTWHQPNSRLPWKNFRSMPELFCLISSSNTLLLNDDVFMRGKAVPDRLKLIRDYVKAGGGFCMVGGYMSFTGIDAKARYNQTAIADVLPVKMLDIDDRCETCDGVVPVVENSSSPIVKNIEGEWPLLLGYNKTIRRDDAEVVVTVNGDPLIAVGEYGKGKTVVFTSDCAPHWGTMEFVNWKHYRTLWANIAEYMCQSNK